MEKKRQKAAKLAAQLCDSLRQWWGAQEIEITEAGVIFIVCATIRGGERVMLFANGATGKKSKNMTLYNEGTFNLWQTEGENLAA